MYKRYKTVISLLLQPGHLFCLSGESSADPGSESSKMDVSLTLTNKFDIFNESNDKLDARGLLLR